MAIRTHEYAGFNYVIVRDGNELRATAVEGQHCAANKDKHRAAAVSTFIEETARIYQSDDVFCVHIAGEPTPPTFASRGAAKAYIQMCSRERRIRS